MWVKANSCLRNAGCVNCPVNLDQQRFALPSSSGCAFISNRESVKEDGHIVPLISGDPDEEGHVENESLFTGWLYVVLYWTRVAEILRIVVLLVLYHQFL